MKWLPLLLGFVIVGCATDNSEVRPPWRVPKSHFGGAKPINIREWTRLQDYPVEAIDAGEQGYVTVSFAIRTDGRIGDCRVSDLAAFLGLT